MTKNFTVVLLFLWSSVTSEQITAAATPPPQHFGGRAFPFGNAHWERPGGQIDVAIPGESYVEIEPDEPLRSSQGSLIVWVKPLVDFMNSGSHTILTARWSGDNSGYLALSSGWWEPTGTHKLYFVLNNQDHAFCMMPGKYNYSIFAEDQWTMVAVTWSAANPGHVRLYVDGQKVCDRSAPFAPDRETNGRLMFGSDRGTSDQRARAADIAIREPQFFARSLSDREIYEHFTNAGGKRRHKWVQAVLQNYKNASPATESRIMFDEDAHWVRSRSETDATLRRIKRAGFNVYVPCVWDGAGALFQTSSAPMAENFRRGLAAGYDPLQYLIEAARRQQIAVHLWFDIARRGEDYFPPNIPLAHRLMPSKSTIDHFSDSLSI